MRDEEQEAQHNRLTNSKKSRASKMAWKKHRDSYMRGNRKKERNYMNKLSYGEPSIAEALEEPIIKKIKSQLNKLKKNETLYNVWKASLILAANNPNSFRKWINNNFDKVANNVFTNAVLELFYNEDYEIPSKDIKEAEKTINKFNKLDKYNKPIQEAKATKDNVFDLEYANSFENMAGGIGFNINKDDGNISFSVILSEDKQGNYKLANGENSDYEALYGELKDEFSQLAEVVDNSLKQIQARHGLKPTS